MRVPWVGQVDLNNAINIFQMTSAVWWTAKKSLSAFKIIISVCRSVIFSKATLNIPSEFGDVEKKQELVETGRQLKLSRSFFRLSGVLHALDITVIMTNLCKNEEVKHILRKVWMGQLSHVNLFPSLLSKNIEGC